MYPIKIYASMVSNLTDARYFAAMGVELIGFDLDSDISQSTIGSIVSWVEGPTFVGETSLVDISTKLQNNLTEIGLSTFLLSPFNENALPSALIRYTTSHKGKLTDPCVLKIDQKFEALNESEIENLYFKLEGLKCYLDIEVKPSDLKRLIDEVKPYGLVVRGGDEERVGVKTFEDLDDLFDALEEIA